MTIPARFALLLMGLGCTARQGGEAEDGAGPAFPNRRARFESEGALLGYVANRRSDTVSVLDLDAMTALGEVPVGRDPVDLDGPRHAVVDASRGALYLLLSYPLAADSPHAVANSGGPRAGYLLELSLDDLAPRGSVRLAPSPTELALSDDRRLLAVSHEDTVLALKNTTDIDARRASVALLEPSGMDQGGLGLAMVPTCVAPAAVAMSVDATLAYVACTGEDSLAVVDTVNKVVTGRVAAGALTANKPCALSRNPVGTRLALSNQVARTLVLFSTGNLPAQLATVTVPGVPFFAGFDAAARLVVPLQDPSGAASIDAASGTIVTAVTYADDVCGNPSDAHYVDDGRLFLVCEGDHYRPGSVVELEPSTLAVTRRVDVGIYPDRLAVRAP